MNRNRFFMFFLFPFINSFILGLRSQLVADDGPAGGSEFEAQALKSLKGIEGNVAKQGSTIETLLTDVNRLDKETKAAMEALTKVKNDANSGIEEFARKLKDLNQQLRLETRGAAQTPIQRIMANEELRERLNIAIRLCVDKDGDMQRKLAPRIKALGENTSPGSTMINQQLLNEIYDTLATYGIWNTFGVRNLGTKTTIMPVKTARPVANFVLTEGGTIADDTAKAGTTVTMTAQVIAVLMNVSYQLLQDAELDITADIMDDFAQAYANRLDYMVTQATGAADATNGSQTGILSGGTASVSTTTHTTIATTDLGDFIRVLTTIDPVVLSRKAKWWIHPTILAKICGIKDLNGRPIFQTALEAPAPGAIGSILGYPVIPSLVLPTADAVSSKVAIFGDPDAIVVGMRSDYMFESSDQFRWNTLERSFRGWGRAGAVIRRATGLVYLQNAAT